MSRLLLISNSTMHGRGYLDPVDAEIKDFVGDRTRIVFVCRMLLQPQPSTERLFVNGPARH